MKQRREKRIVHIFEDEEPDLLFDNPKPEKWDDDHTDDIDNGCSSWEEEDE